MQLPNDAQSNVISHQTHIKRQANAVRFIRTISTQETMYVEDTERARDFDPPPRQTWSSICSLKRCERTAYSNSYVIHMTRGPFDMLPLWLQGGRRKSRPGFCLLSKGSRRESSESRPSLCVGKDRCKNPRKLQLRLLLFSYRTV